jgi:hypothetical protein
MWPVLLTDIKTKSDRVQKTETERRDKKDWRCRKYGLTPVLCSHRRQPLWSRHAPCLCLRPHGIPQSGGLWGERPSEQGWQPWWGMLVSMRKRGGDVENQRETGEGRQRCPKMDSSRSRLVDLVARKRAREA